MQIDDYSNDDELILEKIPLNPKQISGLLDENGSFSSFFTNYEVRIPQLRLTESICKCFNEEVVGVFEAGTGVGKSLAYLLPAMKTAKQNKIRVVVSTGTINLQQQLMEKDIPAAKKVLGSEYSDLKTVLVKGRNNFICLRRLTQALQEQDLFDFDKDELEKLYKWASSAKEGSRSEVEFFITEGLWSRVCSESDNCLAAKCPYFTDCFVMKLKKNAAEAQILIVNHHLLFSDLAAKAEKDDYNSTAVLPPFENIIFDEAHEIENAALSFFSQSITRFDLLKQFNLLYRNKRGTVTGLLPQLVSFAENNADLYVVIIKYAETTQAAFNVVEQHTLEMLKNTGSLSIKQAGGRNASNLIELFSKFYDELTQLNVKLSALIAGVDTDDESILEVVHGGRMVFKRLQAAASLVENFLNWKDFENEVFWFEKFKTSSGEAVRFIQTPLNIASIMRRKVFAPMDSVICISATLKTAGTFDYWMNSVGLKFFDIKKLEIASFESPFPYASNAMLNIPTDIPMPDDQMFQDAAGAVILNLLEVTGGKTLVLFTSYESLKTACSFVRSHIKNSIAVLQQGEDDRTRLLNKFKTDVSSCLFATTSFWTGVDVPGESLSHVILVKLPFAVPSEPIFRAKADIIEKNGGSSFMQLSVPQALILFRQGFGRLMRSKSDRGMVTVLDKRLLLKSYGDLFIRSIPKTIRCFEPLEKIMYNIEAFLNQSGEK